MTRQDITHDASHYAIERAYSDPSAAHERATQFKTSGSYRVVVEPERGRYIVTAWFTDTDTALASLDLRRAGR